MKMLKVKRALNAALAYIEASSLTLEQIYVACMLLRDCNEGQLWRQRAAKRLFAQASSSSDLTEFFICLCVVQREIPELVDGAVTALAVQRLVEFEVRPGGPYLSRSKNALSTNVLIHQFLQNIEAVPKTLTDYLDVHVTQNAEDEFTHFVCSRFMHTTTVTSMAWKNIDSVIKNQNTDGSWGDDDSFLLTLLTIVRLSSCIGTDSTCHKTAEKILRDEIYDLAEKELELIPVSTQALAYEVLSEIKQADVRSDIALISWFFTKNWSHKNTTIDHSKTIRYGLANISLWIAYTIYDDFIDEEAAANLLPLANIMHRKALLTYFDLTSSEAQYKSTVIEAFNAMDGANAWELLNCRYEVEDGAIIIGDVPKFGTRKVLAKRAQGHIIGPLLELRSSDLNHSQQLSVQAGLDQYLIARQLNDDIHDWKEDLRSGQITFVVSYLLKQTNTCLGQHNLTELVTELETYFYRCGFNEINKIILTSCKTARRSLAVGGFTSSGPFMDLIAAIDDSVNKSEHVYMKQQQFLKSYQLL